MITLTARTLRRNLPRAPQPVVDSFIARQHVLAQAGITASATRLSYLFANLDHESAGFSIPDLTENIRYTARRMAQVWPNRFASAAAVTARYGNDAGWQIRAFNDIYGGRMGNRPGTADGSTFIGRGGPQITGRDGYVAVGARTRLDLVGDPQLATAHQWQPDIAAAFWAWKNLNRFADAGDFTGCVRAWNGGLNGLAERQALLKKWQAAFATASAVEEPAPAQKPAPPMSFFRSFIAALSAAFSRGGR